MGRSTKAPVRAAGAVVLRPGEHALRVALVHRDRYDDWTLPKGKLTGDELPCEAAVREVAEETGLTIRIGAPLDRIHYRLGNGADKLVDYWVATVLAEEPRPPDNEISAVQWFDVDDALARLTWDHDRAVLRQALDQPVTTPLLVVRHAKAVKRHDWDGDEATRPLTPYGQRQARRLVGLFTAYGVAAAHSSPWLRCHLTVAPLAAGLGAEVVHHPELTEAAATADPAAHVRVWRQLRDTAADGTVLAVCGHRPALPEALEALGVVPHKVRTAEVVVVHLAADGRTVAHEWHRPGCQ